MPYLLFLKKQQNLKLSSAANYSWRFKSLWASSIQRVNTDDLFVFIHLFTIRSLVNPILKESFNAYSKQFTTKA